MSDNFQIVIAGDAPEAVRLALIDDLHVMAGRYCEYLTRFDVQEPPTLGAVVSVRQPNALERAKVTAEETERQAEIDAEAERVRLEQEAANSVGNEDASDGGTT